MTIPKQSIYRAVAATLTMALLFPASMMAQTPQPAAPTTQSLRILPLAGNNAVNDLERKVMAPLAIQVLDQNDLPVDGATVTFRFPLNGPSAQFADQQTAQTIRTGANGQARAVGWTANNQEGTFVVQVTASRGNEQGVGSITMTNVARILPASQTKHQRAWTSKWAKIGYVAGAAAIATGIILSHRSSSTTITGAAGIPTIGGPQ
jgi:hypothetical protein